MIITPNLNLTVWNLLTDPYDNSQLADNWARVDQHDHSPGKGVQIDGATGIVDGSITPAKLNSVFMTPSDNSITTAKIGDSAVTADKLADADKLGLSGTNIARRGATIIPATESTT